MNVTAISGHSPTNGDSYQIFSWVGGTAGTFNDVNLIVQCRRIACNSGTIYHLLFAIY